MFESRIKNFDVWDIGLIKLSVVLFMMTAVAFSSTITYWIRSMNPWFLLVLVVITASRPVYRFLMLESGRHPVKFLHMVR